MRKNLAIVDTSILIRIITNENPALTSIAFEKIKDSQLFIPAVIIAEVLWVLTSFYNYKKNELVKFFEFITAEFITLENENTVLRSIDIFLKFNLSYVDSYLIADSLEKKIELETLDKKLLKIYSSLKIAS